MKFIITADDYGVSPIIDDAIEEAAEKGLITSIAAFANIPASERRNSTSFDVSKVARFQKRFPGISVGLHLSLTSGPRVADHTTSLCRRRGRDRRFKGPLNQLGNVKDIHVYDEIKAQIALFEEAGIEIQHFSDHHGILNHTEIGKEALFAAVSEYNTSVNKQISIRNPVFVSALIKKKNNFLDTSNASRAASLPLFLRGMFRIILKSRRKLSRIRFRMGLSEQIKLLKEMNEMGIPASDYFVDTLWGSFTENTPRHIFNPANYDVKPNLVLPLHATEPTAEIMVHIAKSKRDFAGNFKQEIRKIKRRKGIDTGYIKNGRLAETRLLRKFLKKYCKTKDRASFSDYIQPINVPNSPANRRVA